MTTNPHHFRDLLAKDTAHLPDFEKAEVQTLFERACVIADNWRGAPCTPEQLPHALALKLLEQSDAPAWVRVLVSKAALENLGAALAAAA